MIWTRDSLFNVDFKNQIVFFIIINKGLVNDYVAERLARDGITLLKEIGHGAFGVVYKAYYQEVVKEKKTAILVAVKLLKGIIPKSISCYP